MFNVKMFLMQQQNGTATKAKSSLGSYANQSKISSEKCTLLELQGTSNPCFYTGILFSYKKGPFR